MPASALAVQTEAGQLAVSIAGLPPIQQAGAPELPVLVFAVGVPAGHSVRVILEESPSSRLAAGPIRPVASFDATAKRWVREPDAAIYSKDTTWPENVVDVSVARFRALEVARVVVYPVRYSPAKGELVFTESLTLRFEFEPLAGTGGIADLGEFERRLACRLVNPDTVLHTSPRDGRRSPEEAATPQAPATGVASTKIAVAAEGWVRVTQAQLAAAGFNVAGVDPKNLELSYRGTPVPARVLGEADGTFGPGDAVEFFGFPNHGRFSIESVYWLKDAGRAGLRLSTRNAAPAMAPLTTVFQSSIHFEPASTIYTFGKPAQEGDPHLFWAWFEDNPNPPRVTTLTHAAVLPGLTSSTQPALFRALFFGRTDPAANPDHRVRLFVNGTQVGESVWNGTTFHTAEIPFNAGLLVPGTNAFRVDRQASASPDIYYMDWIEIDYPRSTQAVSDRLLILRQGDGSARRYSVSGLSSVANSLVLDVSDPLVPVQLTGVAASGGGPFTLSFEDGAPGATRYLVVGDAGRIGAARLTLDTPTDLRNPQNGADLIVVVPEGWEDALEPLAAARRARGLRVIVASLTDVADEFAGGNVDDVAIRDFVAYAYSAWQGPPVSSVLLVGEPNLDAMNETAFPSFHHVMPTHLGVTENWGETMSDTWFGAVAGSDLVPDVAVGRLPVRTEAEAASVAAKLVAHELAAPTPAGGQATNVVLVASDSTAFESVLEASAAMLPGHFTVDTEYRRLGASASSIVGALDDGAVLASFLGHGNVPFWADNPGGPFFQVQDVGALDNAGRLPFISALNCLNGLVAHPNYVDSLSEAFVNRSPDGALAMWAPSALGYLGEYEALQDNLYRAMFQDGEIGVGAATQFALVETFLTAPVSVDLLKSMVLIGDPSSRIAADLDGDAAIDFLEIDGGLDPGDRDGDDDGLFDGLEGAAADDTDGDGHVNAEDPDADNDALPDGLEAGVSVADADTDTTLGSFRADADPASVTDPRRSDTDAGGAPDGAEDRNANGRVDALETDPRLASDDPVCSASAMPEIAALPSTRLRIGKSGSNLVLTWGAPNPARPCLLYRVYVSTATRPTSKADFTLLGVTGQPTFTHVGAAAGPARLRYLVVGHELVGGEGPWGHFE